MIFFFYHKDLKSSLWNSTSRSERMKALNLFSSFKLNQRRSNHSILASNIELVTPRVKERTQNVTEKVTQVRYIVGLPSLAKYNVTTSSIKYKYNHK